MRNSTDYGSEDPLDRPYIELADKIHMLYEAGLSFEANGAFELADQNYRQALRLLRPEDNEKFMALHYRLGRVAEALGNNEEAEENYNEVAATDYP